MNKNLHTCNFCCTFAPKKSAICINHKSIQSIMESSRDSQYGFVYRMPDGELYRKEGRDDDGLYTSYIFRQTFDDDPKEALYGLGVLNCNGIGLENGRSDMQQGVKFFFEAAQHNHPTAEYNAFVAAANGYFCAKNIPWSFQLLQNAIRDGSPEAMDDYADALVNGKPQWGVLKNRKEAEWYYKKAIETYWKRVEAGEAEAYFDIADHEALGLGYGYQPNMDEAICLYIKGVRAGARRDMRDHMRKRMKIYIEKIAPQLKQQTLDAYYKLGLAYLNGGEPNIPQKKHIAEQMFYDIEAVYSPAPSPSPNQQSSSDSSDASIMYSLGLKYLGGIDGTPKNPLQAVQCFTIAASYGSGDACAMLGLCYAEGRGCECDEYTSFKWYQEAYQRGERDLSPAQLAFSYMHGIGVHEDNDKAYYYAMRAIDSPYDTCKSNGYFVLARCYYLGVGGVSQSDYFASSNCLMALKYDPNKTEAEALYRKIKERR